MYGREMEKINSLYVQSDFIECLQQCFDLVKRIGHRDVENYSTLFSCYYKMSAIYSFLSQNNKAIYYAKYAFQYVQTTTERALLNWTLSYIYTNISKWKAIKYINDAIKEYNEIEDFSLFCQASLHKQFLLNNADIIITLIEDLKTFDLCTDRMDKIYKDLVEVYINTNQILKAQCTLFKIKDKSLKNELRTKIDICAESRMII